VPAPAAVAAAVLPATGARSWEGHHCHHSLPPLQAQGRVKGIVQQCLCCVTRLRIIVSKQAKGRSLARLCLMAPRLHSGFDALSFTHDGNVRRGGTCCGAQPLAGKPHCQQQTTGCPLYKVQVSAVWAFQSAERPQLRSWLRAKYKA